MKNAIWITALLFARVASASPSITTTTLPNGVPNVPYSSTLAGAGGTTPYTWSLSSGTLCSGLALSSGGVVSGTPSVQQICSFRVQVQDALGNTATQGLTITITVSSALIGAAAIRGGVVFK
jgi:Putative Ig domain